MLKSFALNIVSYIPMVFGLFFVCMFLYAVYARQHPESFDMSVKVDGLEKSGCIHNN